MKVYFSIFLIVLISNVVHCQENKSLIPNIIQISALKGELLSTKFDKGKEILLSWEWEHRRGFIPKLYLLYSADIKKDKDKFKRTFEMYGGGLTFGYRFSIKELIEPYIFAGFEYSSVARNGDNLGGIKFWRYGISIDYRLSYSIFIGINFDNRMEIKSVEDKSKIKAIGLHLKYFIK